MNKTAITQGYKMEPNQDQWAAMNSRILFGTEEQHDELFEWLLSEQPQHLDCLLMKKHWLRDHHPVANITWSAEQAFKSNCPLPWVKRQLEIPV